MGAKLTVRCAALIVVGILISGAASAANFPTPRSPITIIVGYAAGGTVDAAARLMAADLEKEFGSPVQVLNKPGAASQVGLTQLVNSPPNGYTLAYAVLPTVMTHYLDPDREAPYRRKNFQPVGLHFHVPAMLAVQTASRYRTLKDLVDAAKAAPGKITISDSGLFGTPHVCVLMLERAAGVRFGSVHFDGGAPSVTALLGGHVEVLAGAISDAVPNFKAGNFRVLGIAGDQPSEFLPGVPTMISQGFDVETASATGLLAPPGTPKEIVDVLTNAMRRLIATPQHTKRLSDLGVTPRYLTPDQYSVFWAKYEEQVESLLKAVRGKQ
jgi:tripartite-type tricarboxylate transporter receptor subunit TctC